MKTINFDYIPSKKQEEFHRSNHFINFFGGAVGPGKTCSLVIDCLVFALTYNCTIFLGRAEYSSLRSSTLKELEKWITFLPKHLYTWNKSSNEITFKYNKRAINAKDRYDSKGKLHKGRKIGSCIILSGTQEMEKLKSMTCGAIYLDELSGVKEDSYLILLSRCREPSMFDDEYRVALATNPCPGWVKYTFIKPPKIRKDCNIVPKSIECIKCKFDGGCLEGKNINVVRALASDNPHLPEDYVDRLRKNYPETWVKKFLNGDWEAMEGQVFPYFNQQTMTIEPFSFPSDWPRYFAMDPHPRKPFHMLWCCIGPGNVHYVYDELSMNGTVEEISRMIKRKEQGQYINYRIIDYAISDIPDPITATTISNEFSKYGIYMSHCAKGNLLGLKKMECGFVDGKLKIFNWCTGLIDQIVNAVWDDTDLGKERLNPWWKKENDDYLDCLKYIMLLDLKWTPPIPDYNEHEFIQN